MSIIVNKTGRPRTYNFPPYPGMKNREAGVYLSALNELTERVIDQVIDLPQEALDFSPGNTNLTIGWILIHLGWADARMFGIALGQKVPEDIASVLKDGSAEGLKRALPSYGNAAALTALLRRIRNDFVIPWCSGITDITQPVKEKGPLDTVEKVFMHMCYHWSYHSGHIGLLSLQAGYDYTWTFPS